MSGGCRRRWHADDRFRGTDLRGRVIAKSGFVNGVSCLSGYLHAKDGNWYCSAFSLTASLKALIAGRKVLQERIVRAIDQHVAVMAQAGNWGRRRIWATMIVAARYQMCFRLKAGTPGNRCPA